MTTTTLPATMPPVFLTDYDAFAYEFAVSEARWSQHNVSRLLRATGERPPRVAEMRGLLGRVGYGSNHRWFRTLPRRCVRPR